MRNIVVLIFTIAALSVSALSQTTEAKSVSDPTTEAKAVTSDDSKVTVFVYRYKQFTGSALEPPFLVDDLKIAQVDNGTHFKVKLDPGKHTFQSNDKQAGIMLELKAGEEYYIRMELAEGFWKGKGRLVLVPKEQGAFEIQKLKPLDKKKIMDPSKAFTGEANAKK